MYDICQDFALITKIVELCNQLQLNLIPLQDIMDVFLADQKNTLAVNSLDMRHIQSQKRRIFQTVAP